LNTHVRMTCAYPTKVDSFGRNGNNYRWMVERRDIDRTLVDPNQHLILILSPGPLIKISL
jgi:hypothetical protein